MFEGGPPKIKCMPYDLVIEYCRLLIMDTSWHGLMGGFGGKNGLGICSCPLDPILDVNLRLYSYGVSFIDHLDLQILLHGKP